MEFENDHDELETKTKQKRKHRSSKLKTSDRPNEAGDSIPLKNSSRTRKVKVSKKKSTKEGVDNPSFNNSNNADSTAVQTTDKRPKRAARQLPGLGSTSEVSVRSGDPFSVSTTELNGDDSSHLPVTGKKKAKLKKKKRAAVTSSGTIESLGVTMDDIKDDIVDPTTDQDSEQDAAGEQPHFMRSQHIGKLYIEQSEQGFIHVKATASSIGPSRCRTSSTPAPVDLLKLHLNLTGGFTPTDRDKAEGMYADDRKEKDSNPDIEAYPIKKSSIAFALQSVHGFKTLAHFCMGILAGLAIWQTLYSFTFTAGHNNLSIVLELYRHMSIPINCAFYIILVIVTVATFDRYDIAKINRQFVLQACTLQSGAVACLLYLAALSVNVSLSSMDDRLGPWVNTTSDSLREFKSDEEAANQLFTWRVLGLVRTVLVSLAWFVVALRPGTDRLTKNLKEAELTWAN